MRRSVFAFAVAIASALCLSASAANLLDGLDPDFEDNSGAWSLTGPATFQPAPWASSSGVQGIWFQGFIDGTATLSQGGIPVPASGDYTLTFDSRVEEGFRAIASAFSVTFSGPSGSVTKDLLDPAVPTSFAPFSLTLSGVGASDLLTITAVGTYAGGGGLPQVSAFVDNFSLDVAVPEPSAIALGALGLAAACGLKRRS